MSDNNEKLALLFWSEFANRNREFPCRLEEKKRTMYVTDERFKLLFWSEFSIGNGVFHYQVRKRREVQSPS